MKKFHLIVTVLLLGTVLTLVVLVALGRVEIGFVRPPPPPPAKAAKGPRIERAFQKQKNITSYLATGRAFSDTRGIRSIAGLKSMSMARRLCSRRASEKGPRISRGQQGAATPGSVNILRVTCFGSAARRTTRRSGILLRMSLPRTARPRLSLAATVSLRRRSIWPRVPAGARLAGLRRGPLVTGKEMTVATVVNYGHKEDKSKTTRTAKLKCRLAN